MNIGCISYASTSRSNLSQQKTCPKSPSFCSLSATALIATGVAAVAPLIWIDNQKWSGPTLNQINKKAEMEEAAKSIKSNKPNLSKLIKKLLKKANQAA